MERKVFKGDILVGQLHSNKSNQGKSILNPEVPPFVQTNRQLSDKKVTCVKKVT